MFFKSLLFVCFLMGLGFTAPMVLEFDTRLGDSTSKMIKLALSDTVDVKVDWGDGSDTLVNSQTILSHTYVEDSIYQVKISGHLTRYGAGVVGNINKLVRVLSFGDLGLRSLSGAFREAVNLVEVPEILPSTVTNLNSLFYGAAIFNQSLATWDVGSVISMDQMFKMASSFNQDVSNWQVDSVKSMEAMFNYAYAFNQNIGNWNVSSVENMESMFAFARSFNQDISSWDVSSVTGMMLMFSNAEAFNQNLGSWDVSLVSEFASMFGGDGMSYNNYDSLLIGWSKLKLENDVKIRFGAKFHQGEAATARNSIIQNYNWDIIDAGEAIPNPGLTLTNSTPQIVKEDVGQLRVELSMTDAKNTFGPVEVVLRGMTPTVQSNFVSSGNLIVFNRGFIGSVTVWVAATDGSDKTDYVPLEITVLPLNNVPVLSQVDSQFIAEEYSSLTVLLSMTNAIDVDDSLGDSSVIVENGDNYRVDGNTIIADEGFVGELFVPIQITDGQDTSTARLMVVTVEGVVALKESVSEGEISLSTLKGSVILYSLKGQVLWEGSLPNGLTGLREVVKKGKNLTILKTEIGVFKLKGRME